MTPTLGAIAAFIALQFGIGLWARRRIRSETDYLVAGRRLGYTLATFSIFATWFGAETIIGSSGIVATEGVSMTSAEPFGYGLCLLLLGLLFAVPLWRKKLTTLADLFATRFDSGVARLAAVIMIPSSLLWAAAQIRAFGYVLGTASTFDPNVAMMIAATVVILYTMVGGLLVDAINDVVQGAILILGLLVLMNAAVADIGGWQAAMNALLTSDKIRLGGEHSAPFMETLEAWSIPVLGSLVAAELVSRVIGAKSEKVAKRSAIGAGFLYIAVGLIPVFLAIVASQHVNQLSDPEQLLPSLAQRLLSTGAYMIFAAGLISAILSTVDSTLLVASGLFSHNLIVPIFGVSDERRKVLIARLSVAFFGLVCYFLAVTAEGVFALVEQASAFGSAGVLVTVTFGLFTNFGGRLAAITSLLGGLLSYLAGTYEGIPYPYLTALAVALGGYVGVALLEGSVKAHPVR